MRYTGSVCSAYPKGKMTKCLKEAEVYPMLFEKVPVIAPLDRVDCASVIEEIMVAAPLDRVE